MHPFSKIVLLLIALFLNYRGYGQEMQESQFQSLLDSIEQLNSRTESERYQKLVESLEPNFREDFQEQIKIKYYYILATYYLDYGQFLKTERLLLKADSLSKISENGYLNIPILSALGNLYHRLGKYDQAIQYQELTLQNFEIINSDSSGFYSVMINYSNSLSSVGRPGESIELLLKARDFFKRENKSFALAITLNNMGELYRQEFQDFPAAIKHYLGAKALNDSLGNIRDLLSNYNNLALAYTEIGELDSALFYARENANARKEYNDFGGLAQALHTLGYVRTQRGDLLLARSNLQRSYSICDSLNIQIGKFSCLKSLAVLDTVENKFQDALQKLLRAQGLNQQYIRSIKEEAELLAAISESYERLGNYKAAYEALHQQRAISDSLLAQKNADRLLSLKSEYEKEITLAENNLLKAQEKAQADRLQNNRLALALIAIISLILLVVVIRLFKIGDSRKRALAKLNKAQKELKEENSKVAKKSEELEQANSLKSQILSVMGHDLRSPLAAVSSLLGTISAEEITREELQELLAMLKTETDRSLISLQNVLNWARLHREDVRIFREELDLDKVIKEVIFNYGPGSRSKSLKIEFENHLNQTLWADEHQFQSMCGNLLSNAIKFSPAGTTILIKAEKKAQDLCISICDQGSGISPSILHQLNEGADRLNSSEGTAGEKGTGIGLRIVQDFIKIHGGRLEFSNRPEGGACATLHFPEKSKIDGA